MLRRDDLMNGVWIWQDTELFCFGIDAVLLAHYPELREQEKMLDLGTGTGPIPLILAPFARQRGAHITGLEIQERAAALAKRSVLENGLADTIDIVTGDIRRAGDIFAPASFSLITCNPPYMPAGSGIISENEARAIARTEIRCTLEDVVFAAARLLKMRGRLALILRPSRLAELFVLLSRYGLEPKRMRLVHPRAGGEPTMVLAEAVRGGKPFLKVEPPLIVYEETDRYTKEIMEIYGWDAVSGCDPHRQS